VKFREGGEETIRKNRRRDEGREAEERYGEEETVERWRGRDEERWRGRDRGEMEGERQRRDGGGETGRDRGRQTRNGGGEEVKRSSDTVSLGILIVSFFKFSLDSTLCLSNMHTHAFFFLVSFHKKETEGRIGLKAKPHSCPTWVEVELLPYEKACMLEVLAH
jgi:hypothetical protein